MTITLKAAFQIDMPTIMNTVNISASLFQFLNAKEYNSE